jgi:trehalose-6-phosphate synthase
MSSQERTQRMQAMHRTVSTRDIRWWTRTFLEMIEGDAPGAVDRVAG